MDLRHLAAIVLFLASFHPASAGEEASPAWGKLTSVVGTWFRPDATSPEGKLFRISYKLISGDTTLVETFGNPAGRTTQTVFHLDGPYLMATHYCAQGNQPRLRVSGATTGDSLTFEYLDATNLKSPEASHLVRLKVEFVDQTHIRRTEVYRANGQEEVSVLNLERVVDLPPPPGSP